MSEFKIVKVEAFDKEEVQEHLDFDITRDATMAWKNAGKPKDEDLYQFCDDYLSKHTHFANGLGCIICVENGKPNKLARRYKVEKVKGEGARKYKTAYIGVNTRTQQIMFTVKSNDLKEAENQAKMVYGDPKFTDDLEIQMVKLPTTGKVVRKVNYMQSKGTKVGTYYCFGIEK